MPTRIPAGMLFPEKTLEKKRLIVLAVLLLAGLAILEWRHQLEFSLGIFYTIPVIIASLVLNRRQIVLLAFACALLRGLFTPANSDLEFFLKYLMASIAYCGAGLVVVEMSNSRRRLLEHYARLRLEQDRRRHAEEQLRILAESSPAAILTLNADMVVLAANHAAHEMLSLSPGQLIGTTVGESFPLFESALKVTPGDRPIRTAVTGWAQRPNGEKFPVQAWFSIYGEREGKCLAAILVDVSEELRDREWDNFRHMLDYNRLLAGAVSHEIRNLCSAIAVVYANLKRKEVLQGNEDFEALNHLVAGLSRLASFKLEQRTNGMVKCELKSVLDQLRVIIEPDWTEVNGVVRYDVADTLPAVHGDAYGMMQIFLNLSQNSRRAVSDGSIRELHISAQMQRADVVVSFVDSGPGISDDSTLFQPFRPGANGSGLGLYVARELARSFGGDLVHVPTEDTCRFDVILSATHSVNSPAELEHASI